jgi:hypothetical protein
MVNSYNHSIYGFSYYSEKSLYKKIWRIIIENIFKITEPKKDIVIYDVLLYLP